ncbi:hypothetical protein CHS0354_002963 [Potamilus streckersoni]|uniref:Uncharacterized protein n=1 Tax=Potamilus streckersoni TaxID=2493646 RepID=A0AAE0RS81_9BIVA|nr:hypothetical protein CHS0354_002963 [Potamilus streckersoni]
MSTSANDKLTIQAVKEHDKIHPKFKATISAGSKDQKDTSKVSVGGTSVRSYKRSQSESSKSEVTGQKASYTKPKINLFRLVVATQAWQRLAKRRSRAQPTAPVVKLENTYRLEPKEGETFPQGKVEQILKNILEFRLSDVTYDPARCKYLTTELTSVIKEKVKALKIPRYKLVCTIALIDNNRQGLHIASRCIWNHDTDNFASYTYSNSSLIAVANVYGVYFE